MALLNPDRLFPTEPQTRNIARELFEPIENLPLVCPHGHTDPAWFADDQPFADPARLLVVPDHYLLRMLFSQGIQLEQLGIAAEGDSGADGRDIWREFARHYHLFRGTPSRLWLDHTFETLFGLSERLCAGNADAHYEHISDCLSRDEFRPRALYERFNIEAISTTDSALDDLQPHQSIVDSDWSGRVLPCYRPDAVIDPDNPDFQSNLRRLGEISGCATDSWQGYLDAHRQRRQYFKQLGATATDHGHPSARTADLDSAAAAALFEKVSAGTANADDKELFRAQMLTEMAAMSIDDGLVMQIHAGSRRNHQRDIFRQYGADKGFDIPGPTDYVESLRPLLNRFGTNPELSIILFTLDDSTTPRALMTTHARFHPYRRATMSRAV